MRNLYITVCLLIYPYAVHAETGNDVWVEEAKSVNANVLDTTLPKTHFEKWFVNFTATSKATWEVNGCGEQDGSGKQTDFPICVDAQAELANGDKLIISIALGTYKKGMIGLPKIWMIYAKENGKFKVLKNIKETENFLANARPLYVPNIGLYLRCSGEAVLPLRHLL